jgi:hypothetical protein
MKKLILFLSFAIGLMIGFAQEVPTEERPLYLVRKSDGNEFYGYIISDDGREILLETKTIGKIFINKSDIRELKKVDEKSVTTVSGEFRATGPFTTRYIFTTNALPIKKDEHYALIHLYGPEVHFAVSDNLSLGVMSTWIGSPIALAAKYSFNSKSNTYFSVGTLMGSSGYLNQGRGFGGLHFLTVTKGDRKQNLSFSAGYGYYSWDLTRNSQKNLIGERYSFQNYMPNSAYYVSPEQAYSAVDRVVYPNYSSDYSSRYFYSNETINKAFAFGLSGIAPVGKKASFIFDSMLFLGYRKRYEVIYKNHDVEVTYYDWNTSSDVTETFTIGKGSVVENGTEYSSTLVLMPAMRFNRSYDQAFQVALAGIFSSNFKGDVNSFPVPMVSWLRKF